nr:S-layer homology domain-containing protein [uncultured Oscillibacter sp.]
MKTGKKLLALLLAVVMTMSLLTVGAFAEETPSSETPLEQQDSGSGNIPDDPAEGPADDLTGNSEDGAAGESDAALTAADTSYVAEVDGQQYETLQAAVDAVQGSGTIELTSSIALSDQVTIDSGKTIILDMNGETLSIGFSDSSKNLIVNNGTLTITGDGTFDATEATSYKGFINNYGTLTVENGTFQIADKAMTVHLRNQDGGKAVINGGTFSGGATIVRSFEGSNTTITGGSFTNSVYPAVDVNGETLITGGIFTNTSCSRCDSQNWGYTVRSGVDNDPDAKLTITPSSEGSVVVTGTQGALSATAGTMEVNGGSYKTVDCAQKHGAVFYALYVAGEAGAVQVVVNDGTFVTEGKQTAVLVGNSNDGGLKEQAVLQIRGGQFSAPEGIPAYKVDVALGGLNITGGTFSSDVSKYLAEGLGQDANGTVGKVEEGFAAVRIGDTYYQTLAKAIAEAKENDTITLLREVDLGSDRVTINKAVTLDLNGCTLTSSNATNTLWLEASRVTVQDSKGNGKIQNTGSGSNNIAVVVNGQDTEAYFKSGTVSGNYAVFIQNGAKAVIDGGKYTGTYGINTVGTGDEANKTAVEINGGEIQAVAFAVAGNGSADYTETVITGGRLESTEGNVIYHPQVGDLTIKGDAELIGPNGVQYCGAGTLTIAENAVITATLPFTEFPTKPASQGDGSTDDGAALSVVSRGGGYQGEGQTMTVNITGGTLTSRNNAAIAVYRLERVNGQWTTNENTKIVSYLAALTVSGGNFSAGSKKDAFEIDTQAADKISVTGGYFTSDPSDYVPENAEPKLFVVASDKTGYAYMVTTTKPTEVDPIVTEKTETEVSESIKTEDKEKIEAVIDKAQVSGVSDAVTESAQNAIINQVEGALNPEDKVVVEITVSLTADKADLTTADKMYVSYKAEPVAKVIVNDESVGKEIPVTNDYLDGQTLIEVRLPIPEDLEPQEIMHIADDGTRERYLNGSGFTVEDGCAVLHVKHFSTFVLNGQLTVAAKIGESEYGTLQEAVNAAKSGDTIVLTQDCDEKISVSGKSVTIDLDGHTYDKDKITLGSRCSMSVSDDKITITYSAPSGGGSSSSSSGDYTVSVENSKHGTVTVSPKRADKGDTVTITVKPDNGYELDELTVTDKDGDTVKLQSKGGNKYTFTMPGSKVTVEATFTLEKEENLPFADVAEDYWAVEEITWAYENGYMNGVSAERFAPGSTVTRQQLWMVLARLTEFNPSNMTEAQHWAVESKISDGSNPGGALTRQQMVTILYRWAQQMGYDVSGRADLSAFPDNASVAAYATEPMTWAIAEGIISGTTEGLLNPAGTATRAQFAVILYRFFENVM